MTDEVKTNQITLTADQLINMVGHTATQDQLDGVRRELREEIKDVETKVNARIEKLDVKIDSSVKELRTEIKSLDSRLWWIAGLIVALAFKSEILGFFQG